jgi:hypothetical protein
MTLSELDQYISTLRSRLAGLRGPGLKSTTKLIAVAEREREAKASP